MLSSLSVALAWQEAVNGRDVERTLELSDPNIEIAGPRGSGYGHALLRDWMGQVRLRFETVRTFEQEENVVIEQHAAWLDPATDEVIGERDVASHFRVAGGKVILYARYDALEEALKNL